MFAFAVVLPGLWVEGVFWRSRLAGVSSPLSRAVRSAEQSAPPDFSLIHLVKTWLSAGGLCLRSISANKKQPSLSRPSCPPARRLVRPVSSGLKGSGSGTALRRATNGFPIPASMGQESVHTRRLQSSRVSLQHLKKFI